MLEVRRNYSITSHEITGSFYETVCIKVSNNFSAHEGNYFFTTYLLRQGDLGNFELI